MSENRKRYSSAPLYGLNNSGRNQGGGFQVRMDEPKAVQRVQKKRNFVFLQVCLTLVLPIVFIVALILGYSEVHWGFVGLSVLALVLMWALGAFIPQARKTMTLIYTALIMVSAAAALWFTTSLVQPAEDASTAFNGGDLSGLFGRDVTASQVGTYADTVNANNNIQPAAKPEETPDSRSLAQERLEQFMNSWMNLDYTAMLNYCSPAWKNAQSNPEQAIFKVRGTQTPTNFDVIYVAGNDADDSRTITMEAMIDRGDGNEPTKYRYEVLMLRVNGQWYVDPASLTTATKVVDAGTPTVNYTLMPTNSPDPNQILYYNPDGGSYYHTDDNCSSTSIKYLPLKGSFRYSEIANYDLKPCTKCNAPNR